MVVVVVVVDVVVVVVDVVDELDVVVSILLLSLRNFIFYFRLLMYGLSRRL